MGDRGYLNQTPLRIGLEAYGIRTPPHVTGSHLLAYKRIALSRFGRGHWAIHTQGGPLMSRFSAVGCRVLIAVYRTPAGTGY